MLSRVAVNTVCINLISITGIADWSIVVLTARAAKLKTLESLVNARESLR